MSYFKYWGKASRDKESGQTKYHLLLYYFLDADASINGAYYRAS